MRLEQHKDLWTRILNFHFDDSKAAIKFSDKLSFENNWTKQFTWRTIEEYRKFIFLCCISPTGASPSEIVDEVWHLHLTYTHNYWKGFCEKTLGKEIHHHPSKGGIFENEKHQRWYADTLKLYREVFEEEPPADIWPAPGTMTAKSKKQFSSSFKVSGSYLILIVPFLLSGVWYDKLNPYNLTGQQFLWFYFWLCIAGGGLFLYLGYQKQLDLKKKLNSVVTDKITVFQVARFAFGRIRAIQTAIVDLVEKGILQQEKGGRLRFHPGNYYVTPYEENPLIENLLKVHKENEPLEYAAISTCYDDNKTFHAQLSNVYQSLPKYQYKDLVILLIVILIGIARGAQGISNGRPVVYLFAGMLLFVISSIIIADWVRPSKILSRVFKTDYRQNSFDFITPYRANDFAFTGAAAFMGLAGYIYLQDMFSKNNPRDSGFASNACGSSGCGSSCGGGGGCGGCGGGGD